MTGTLQIKTLKKGEFYYTVIDFYDANGKRKPKWESTGLPVKGNKKRAQAMLEERLEAARENLQCKQEDSKGNVLFVDWLKQWLEIKKPRIDEITYQGYESNANNHVIPYFEALGLRLSEITRPILQAYFDEKACSGNKRTGGGLSAASLIQYKNIINQALKEAVFRDVLPQNPCEGIILPKLEKSTPSFCTEPQLQKIIAVLRGELIWPIIVTEAIYGLRRCEVMGLKWDCFDFDNKRFVIQHTVVKQSRTVAKDKTKNPASHRTFPIEPKFAKVLDTLRAEEEKNRRLFGREYHENSYIFKWPDGRPISLDYATQRFKALLAKHDLPHTTLRALRHSCASLMLAKNWTLKDAQEWLGHADIKMTANVYGHLEMGRKAAIGRSVESCFELSE